MTRRTRSAVALAALGVLGAVLVVAVTGLEPFGHYPGPYGDVLARVVPGERHTGQLVAATVFDYRGFDTLGEEMILFAAACGCAALLRVLRREREEEEERAGAAGAELRGAGDGRGAGRPGHGPRRLRHRRTGTSPRAAASRAASSWPARCCWPTPPGRACGCGGCGSIALLEGGRGARRRRLPGAGARRA